MPRLLFDWPLLPNDLPLLAIAFQIEIEINFQKIKKKKSQTISSSTCSSSPEPDILNVLHSNSWLGSPVNRPRQLFNRSKCSSVGGFSSFHRMQSWLAVSIKWLIRILHDCGAKRVKGYKPVKKRPLFDFIPAHSARHKIVFFRAEYFSPEINPIKLVLFFCDRQRSLQRRSLLNAQHNASVS